MPTKKISQKRAKQMESDIHSLLWKLYMLDDKPHQLFGELQVMVLRYAPKWWDVMNKKEAIRMSEVGYYNAFKILKGVMKDENGDVGEKCRNCLGRGFVERKGPIAFGQKSTMRCRVCHGTRMQW